jgi:hypothetical protein
MVLINIGQPNNKKDCELAEINKKIVMQLGEMLGSQKIKTIFF